MRFLKSIGRLAFPLVLGISLGSCSLRLPVQKNPVATTVPPPPIERKAGKLPAQITSSKDPDTLVWLVADSLHTGMIFPYDWLLESGYVPPANFGRPRAVSMSWGNRDAYVEKRWLSPWKVCRALFSPSPSVMEIIPIDWNIAEVVPHQRIYRKLVPRDRGPAIAAFLNGCSRNGPDGRPLVIGPSSWGDGVLLESKYSYFFPRICNVWTVQAMEATGCQMDAWTALFAPGVVDQAQKPRNGFEKIWNGPEKPAEPVPPPA